MVPYDSHMVPYVSSDMGPMGRWGGRAAEETSGGGRREGGGGGGEGGGGSHRHLHPRPPPPTHIQPSKKGYGKWSRNNMIHNTLDIIHNYVSKAHVSICLNHMYHRCINHRYHICIHMYHICIIYVSMRLNIYRCSTSTCFTYQNAAENHCRLKKWEFYQSKRAGRSQTKCFTYKSLRGIIAGSKSICFT